MENIFFYFFLSTVKPLTVQILTREPRVLADKRYNVECKSSGSRPTAAITWWKGDRELKNMTTNVSYFMFFFTKAKKRNIHKVCFIFIFLLFFCFNGKREQITGYPYTHTHTTTTQLQSIKSCVYTLVNWRGSFTSRYILY